MRIRQDQGCKPEAAAFLERTNDGPGLRVPLGELERVTEISLAAVRSANEGTAIESAPWTWQSAQSHSWRQASSVPERV